MRRETGNIRRATISWTGCFLLLSAAAMVMSCATSHEVPIEVPLSPKLDVTKYDRLLVAGFTQNERYRRDAFGQPQRVRQASFQERTGYVLSAEFYFIDSGTGETIHRERFTEEVIYGREEQVLGLASYFELMDRVLPNFMQILSPQTFRGTRVLLR